MKQLLYFVAFSLLILFSAARISVDSTPPMLTPVQTVRNESGNPRTTSKKAPPSKASANLKSKEKLKTSASRRRKLTEDESVITASEMALSFPDLTVELSAPMEEYFRNITTAG